MKRILFYLTLPFFLMVYIPFILIKNVLPSTRARQSKIISSILGTLAKQGETETNELFELVISDTKEIISQNEFVRFLDFLHKKGHLTQRMTFCDCHSCMISMMLLNTCTVKVHWKITSSGRRKKADLLEKMQEKDATKGLVPVPA